MKKQFENSLLIEGDYNYNYLTNLLFLARNCLTHIFIKKRVTYKENKKLFKNIKNLLEFLESSIQVFNRLSVQDNDDRVIVHNIEYRDKLIDNVVNEVTLKGGIKNK